MDDSAKLFVSLPVSYKMVSIFALCYLISALYNFLLTLFIVIYLRSESLTSMHIDDLINPVDESLPGRFLSYLLSQFCYKFEKISSVWMRYCSAYVVHSGFSIVPFSSNPAFLSPNSHK